MSLLGNLLGVTKGILPTQVIKNAVDESAPQVAEPEANQLLRETSGRMYTMSREQFDGLRKQRKQMMEQAGQQQAGVQGERAVAASMQRAGPATEAYGPRATATRRTGGGLAENAVRRQAQNESAAGQVNLLSDAARIQRTGMSHLGALSQMQYNQNAANAQRKAGNQADLGGLVGTGIGIYAGRKKPVDNSLDWIDAPNLGINWSME